MSSSWFICGVPKTSSRGERVDLDIDGLAGVLNAHQLPMVLHASVPCCSESHISILGKDASGLSVLVSG